MLNMALQANLSNKIEDVIGMHGACNSNIGMLFH